MRIGFFFLVVFFLQSLAYAEQFTTQKLVVQTWLDKPQGLVVQFPYGERPLKSEFRLLNGNSQLSADFTYLVLWPKKSQEEDLYIRSMVIDVKDLDTDLTTLRIQYKPSDNSISKNKHKSINTAVAWLRAGELQKVLLLSPKELKQKPDWYSSPFKKYARFLTDQKTMDDAGFPQSLARQWLYDRAQSLYTLWTFTFEEQWLHKAKKTTDFYIENLDEQGRFLDRGRLDIKYLMPRSILYSYLLTGEKQYLNALEKVFRLSLRWDGKYTQRTGFWTERNFASVFNAALSYWEATQNIEAANRIEQLLEYATSMMIEPTNSWQSKRCLQHTLQSHEGSGGNSPVCSPWMSALLADGLWRYYKLTGHNKAEALIESLGEFVLHHGIYFDEKHFPNKPIPKYLAVIGNSRQESRDAWSDRYHACDVAALVGRAAFIKREKNKDAFLLSSLMTSLVDLCNTTHPANQQRKQALRIVPPRKFNWMYGTTADLPWLVEYFNR